MQSDHIHFYELQVLTLLGVLQHMHHIRATRRQMSGCYRCERGVVLEAICFVLVRCQWELREESEMSYSSYTFRNAVIVGGLYKAIPYVLFTVLGASVVVASMRLVPQSQRGNIYHGNRYMWLFVWVIMSMVLCVMDIMSITSIVVGENSDSVGVALFKVWLEKCVLLVSVLGCVWALVTAAVTTMTRSESRNDVHHRSIAIDRKCHHLLHCAMVLALHISHLVIVTAKRPRQCALLLVIGCLYVLSLTQSMIHHCVYDATALNIAPSFDSTRIPRRQSTICRRLLVGVVRLILVGKLLYFITGHHFAFSALQVMSCL